MSNTVCEASDYIQCILTLETVPKDHMEFMRGIMSDTVNCAFVFDFDHAFLGPNDEMDLYMVGILARLRKLGAKTIAVGKADKETMVKQCKSKKVFLKKQANMPDTDSKIKAIRSIRAKLNNEGKKMLLLAGEDIVAAMATEGLSDSGDYACVVDAPPLLSDQPKDGSVSTLTEDLMSLALMIFSVNASIDPHPQTNTN